MPRGSEVPQFIPFLGGSLTGSGRQVAALDVPDGRAKFPKADEQSQQPEHPVLGNPDGESAPPPPECRHPVGQARGKRRTLRTRGAGPGGGLADPQCTVAPEWFDEPNRILQCVEQLTARITKTELKLDEV
jgi:hypothetical protein